MRVVCRLHVVHTMSSLTGRSWMSWVLAIGLAGCGPSVATEDGGQSGGGSGDQDDDDASPAPLCTAQACGGDPAGEWAVVGACVVDVSRSNSGPCDPEECTVEILEAEGDYAIGASSNLSLDLVLDARCRLPKSCFDDGQCDDDGDDDNGVCVNAGDACECSRVTEASFSAAGRYLVQGEELQLLDGDVIWVTKDWCVIEDSLEIDASVSWGVPGYRNILGVRASLERAE